MSMPIINLPIERIEKHLDATFGYANDQHVSPAITKAVHTVLGANTLDKAPFHVPSAWRFATHSPFNIADGIPDGLAKELSTEGAASRASRMPTSQWCSVLRNAMAHGGIAYLDEYGRTSYERPVKMYAFISGKFEHDTNNLIKLNILRIGEEDYRIFLRKWVAWLKSSGLDRLAA
jgi:hypothetical protein